ncbi:hypothetical protein BH11PSE11_BH11PSE11_09220 [soil metagenome]
MTDWKRAMHGVKRPLAMLLLCGATLTLLQGCVEMVASGVVVGTLAATDRRTFGAQTEDQEIMFKAGRRISNIINDDGHVNVTSFNRKVLLTGEVKDEAMKAAVERETASVAGVLSIVNELDFSPITSFTSRSNDVLITGKIRASFVDDKQLSANAFKVVTEHGNVYLMGRVTEREGAIAAKIASGVSGVRKVVKIFEYISDEELRRLQKL